MERGTTAALYKSLLDQGYTIEGIAQERRIKPESVTRILRDAGFLPAYAYKRGETDTGSISVPNAQQTPVQPANSPQRPSDLVTIPKSLSNDEKPLQVPTENVLVFGDMHAPYHNEIMLQRAIYVARKFYPHVRDVVFGGDTFNMDAISIHPKNARSVQLDVELIVGGDVAATILNCFDRGWIIPGNHDERVAKKLDQPFSTEQLFGAAFAHLRAWPTCELHFSNLDYLYIGEHWIAGHPSKYSGQGGKMPSDLAQFYRRNTVSFHNHIVGESQSKDGDYIGIDAGHMTDPDKHFYVKRRFNTFTRWRSGFVVISNGYAYRYTDMFTDWSALGA